MPPGNCQCVQLDEIQSNDLEKAEDSHVKTIKPDALYLQRKGDSRERNAAKEKILYPATKTLKAKDGATNPPTYSQDEHSVI